MGDLINSDHPAFPLLLLLCIGSGHLHRVSKGKHCGDCFALLSINKVTVVQEQVAMVGLHTN